MRLRWILADLAEVPTFARLASGLRRASADGHDTCATLVPEQAARHGDRPLLRFEDGLTSYADFERGANRYARLLRREGVGRGDVFALAMRNSPDALMAQTAAAKLGAVAALVNHQLEGKALEHVLATSGARHVLVDADTLPAVAEVSTDATVWATGDPAVHPPGVEPLGPALAASDEGDVPTADLRGRDVFLYIYTSGTTGYPKPAIIRHMRFTMAGIALGGIFGIGADDVIYAPLPLYHGQSNFVGFSVALRSGGSFASRRRFSAGAFLEDVRGHGATMLVYVGELCRYLLAQPPTSHDRDHRLRIAAGAGLRPDVWTPFRERFGIDRIYEMYGATEGNINLMNRANRPGSVGKPQPFQFRNVALARYDVERDALARTPEGRLVPCADGEVGEILGRVGTGVIEYDGYVDREATERKLVRDAFRTGDAWFRSGDLLRRDADGFYYFVDRIGDTFRWKGENVATQEVEETVATAPGVDHVNVYGVEVPGHDGRAGMAALVLSDGAELDPAALYARVRADLPPYARPLFLRVVDAIEVTGTLKLRKGVLRDEGFDPSRISDPLYLRDDDSATYVPFTAELDADVRSGARRV